jgi:hypothetical protein
MLLLSRMALARVDNKKILGTLIDRDWVVKIELVALGFGLGFTVPLEQKSGLNLLLRVFARNALFSVITCKSLPPLLQPVCPMYRKRDNLTFSVYKQSLVGWSVMVVVIK